MLSRSYTNQIEYARRHLPLKVYEGDGETEKLTSSYLYTAEGKLRAEILHGEENWVREYEYKNGVISEIKQFMVVEPVETTINETSLQNLLNTAGENVYSQKYDYQLQNANKKLLTVTDALGYVSLF